MAKKKKTTYSGPALTESNLPEYDKSELVTERSLIARAEACKDAAKIAEEQIAKLQTEQKALDKKSPDFKKKSKEIDTKIKAQQGVAKKTCTLRHPGCVPSDKSKRVTMPKSITDEINKQYKTNVDFDKLSEWEGGAYTKAYIPWWPYLDKKGKPEVVTMPDSSKKEGPRIKGDLSGKPKNNSGPTAGIGVDLGTKDEKSFFSLLDRSNSGTNGLTSIELSALKEKIKPYLLKQGGEACKYLRDHPLEFTDKEIIFLNKAAHEDALKNSIAKYEKWAGSAKNSEIVTAPKKFKDLTQEQQTSALSNLYQYGENSKMSTEMIEAIATEKREKIPQTREHDYLFNSIPAPAKKQ